MLMLLAWGFGGFDVADGGGWLVVGWGAGVKCGWWWVGGVGLGIFAFFFLILKRF